MSVGHRSDRQTQLLLVAMALVLAAVFLYPPRGDDEVAAPPTPSATTTEPETVPAASEEEFCAEFRRLAAAQGEYAAVPDQTATVLLREAVDRMVAVGVPETMTLPARGGYYTVLEGIYSSLGLSLDRSAVGALEDPVDGEDAALSRFLVELCPA